VLFSGAAFAVSRPAEIRTVVVKPMSSTIPRRAFLRQAGVAGTAIATGFAANTPTSAQTQTVAADPAVRPADLVLKNAKIITVDRDFSIVQAVAIAGDRILAVGSDASMAAYAAQNTQVLDLQGRTVMPGMIDGHAHMDREGLKGIYPALGPVRSIRDIQNRIADLASAKPRGEWIVTMPIGDPPYYFDVPDILAEKRWPTRQELDAAAPENPVFIRSIWGFWRHTLPLVSIANTEALRRAGITRDTVSPVESLTIEKDSAGNPTGVFIENEMQPLAELIWFRQLFGFTRADRASALPVSMQAYHACGTTSVFEEHGVANEVIRAYKDAYRDGTLTMRSALVFSPNWKAMAGAPLGPFIEAWAGWLGEPAFGDDWLKLAGVYINIGKRLSDDLRASASPYTGWAGFNYDTGLPRGRVKELLLHLAANDIRAICNANISPGLIDLLSEVDREVPLKGRRWVIGHVSLLSPKDIERIVHMGLLVTPHTNEFIYKEGRATQGKLPPDRRGENTPLRDLLDAGVNVGLVTDNVPVSMFWPVWQSIARRDRTNEPVSPEQALTRVEALRCATYNNAFLTFDEDRKGSLEPGKLADLTVLSADPLTVEEIGIRDIKSLMTMVGGRIVYETPTGSVEIKRRG
jgi:predicted amidohydrolase YtcJ